MILFPCMLSFCHYDKIPEENQLEGRNVCFGSSYLTVLSIVLWSVLFYTRAIVEIYGKRIQATSWKAGSKMSEGGVRNKR